MKKKRKFRNRSFCMMEAELIESKAFMELSNKAAVVILMRFHQKLRRRKVKRSQRHLREYDYTNNGELVLTYGEAEELGIKRSVFYRALKELVEDKGFINVAEPGNWYERKPTKFAIARRWKQYGTEQYKREKMKRGLTPGIGFKKGNWKGFSI